jgi:regulatory protein
MRGRKPTASSTPPRDRALALLARREHSERELRRKLVGRGVEADDAKAVVDELAATELVDDGRFAHSLVRRRSEAGYGPRHIAAELATHGIRGDDARDALAEVDFEPIARRILARRLGPGTPDATARARAAQFLMRRGFPGDLVSRLTRVGGLDDDPADA